MLDVISMPPDYDCTASLGRRPAHRGVQLAIGPAQSEPKFTAPLRRITFYAQRISYRSITPPPGELQPLPPGTTQFVL